MSSSLEQARRKAENDEICPVCKASRYLNPDMIFLIHPKCYHKMCGSCVDRIFASGYATCPVVGCNHRLRKHGFRSQTFEDLEIEREVDIRKRVMNILNRREEEFETKMDWDNFLEEREEIVMNLLTGIDVEKTEARLEKYRAANAASIKRNQNAAAQEDAAIEQLMNIEKEQSRLMREAFHRDLAEEKKALEDTRKQVIDQLATASVTDADRVIRDAERAMTAKRKLAEASSLEQDRADRKKSTKPDVSAPAQVSADGDIDGYTIKGLRKTEPAAPEKPYDIYYGYRHFEEPDYYTLQRDYTSPMYDSLRKDARIAAGGYDFRQYFSRTIFEAFAGLACFLDEEKSPSDSQDASQELTVQTAA